MERRVVPGAGFRHLVFIEGDLAAARDIHIYLEGDGLPWATRYRVAPDPTPRSPLALRLMASDPAPSIYLGRPCYFGLTEGDPCSPWLWTHGRYSPQVVDSMRAAIASVLPPDSTARITLIGYSGGGVLAALIAPRLAGEVRLVTIAANLDIDAWADHHGYSRLSGSLNPAGQPPLDARIEQLHLTGGRDQVVPSATSARFLARNPGAAVRSFGGYDHRCCWREGWPEILASFDASAVAIEVR